MKAEPSRQIPQKLVARLGFVWFLTQVLYFLDRLPRGNRNQDWLSWVDIRYNVFRQTINFSNAKFSPICRITKCLSFDLSHYLTFLYLGCFIFGACMNKPLPFLLVHGLSRKNAWISLPTREAVKFMGWSNCKSTYSANFQKLALLSAEKQFTHDVVDCICHHPLPHNYCTPTVSLFLFQVGLRQMFHAIIKRNAKPHISIQSGAER